MPVHQILRVSVPVHARCARVLAHFAEIIQPQARPLPDAQTRELMALVARRRQVVQMLTAESNGTDERSAVSIALLPLTFIGFANNWPISMLPWSRRFGTRRYGLKKLSCSEACRRSAV